MGGGGPSKEEVDVQNQWGTLMGKMPTYQSAFNPATQSLTPDLEKKLAGINLNTQGLDQYRKEATRVGPSSWAQLQGGQINQQAMDAREAAAGAAATGSAQARSDLGMRGGLSSGARERIARGGARDFMSAGQDINRQAGAAKTGIAIQDESNRINQLGQLPGMEVQSLQPELQKTQMWGTARAGDLQQAIDEAKRKGGFDMDTWKALLADLQGQREALAQK